ncbi:MAG: NAD-dependent epimerase/dehydratase family protein [Phycisphaerales bacterium]|nr:NAD-dependent epimerase/dehydratase family protein [Phycisphaerales bacterium]
MNLVTGASGLLGSHIVEQLRLRGKPVRVLVRKSSDRSWLNTQGVEFAEGDVTDRASLERACRGCDVVYHSAARVGDWGPWPEFEAITIEGTRNVVESCIATKVRRLVHISSVSTYGYHTKAVTVDETVPLGYKLYKWAYYSRSKIIAEQIVWDGFKTGKIEVAVIRPAWLYGPRDRTTIGRLVEMVRAGKAKILGPGHNRLNLVHAANVAEACILAADDPKANGESFNCSNDGDIKQIEFFDKLAKAAGAPPVKAHAPYRAAYFAGYVLEVLGHAFNWQKPPMITRYAVWLMGRLSYFSADKARRVLGWRSTIGYDEGIPDAVRWYDESKRGAGAKASQRELVASGR